MIGACLLWGGILYYGVSSLLGIALWGYPRETLFACVVVGLVGHLAQRDSP